ncbi:MAG: methyltransferase [Methanomicrobiales archaeon]|nr:methyltransferase [Methanomicrobiales archaeon]
MPFDPAQVYQPEADTFLLLNAALQELRPADRVLEIGTGSGLIASRLDRAAYVVATDINPHAVRSARECGAEVIRTDLFAGIRGTFDIILFNPPYLPTQPDERIDDWLEYALDGGETGRETIDRFARDAGRVLAREGRILLLISELTGVDETADMFSRQGYSCRTVAETDAEGEMLYVLKCTRQSNELAGRDP